MVYRGEKHIPLCVFLIFFDIYPNLLGAESLRAGTLSSFCYASRSRTERVIEVPIKGIADGTKIARSISLQQTLSYQHLDFCFA